MEGPLDTKDDGLSLFLGTLRGFRREGGRAAMVKYLHHRSSSSRDFIVRESGACFNHGRKGGGASLELVGFALSQIFP